MSGGEAVLSGSPWRDELERLREILRASGLVESVKWGTLCYSVGGRNVVGIGGFKSYFALWFFQGARLEDANGVLLNAQPGKTKALRQWRMQSAREIDPTLIQRYVREAIALAESGRPDKPARSKPLVVPPELQRALASDARAARSFAALRIGVQREYADYVASAKRPETRQQRIAKILPMIVLGVGLNDRYR